MLDLTKEAGAPDIDKERVLLTVKTDASGVALVAVVAGDDVRHLPDPRFRAFAQRAIARLPTPIIAQTYRFQAIGGTSAGSSA